MSISTAVTPTTKAAVLQRDAHRCWVCGEADHLAIQVAHLIPLARNDLLEQYTRQGLLPPSCTEISCAGNLILLCVLCHVKFDGTPPRFVILPQDLRAFIEWENRDYERRSAAAEAGDHVPQRKVPDAYECEGNFRVYHFGGFANMPEDCFAEKAWGGAPTAMILKACIGALQPVVVTEKGAHTIPAAVRSEMAELMNQYSRPEPVSAARADTGKGEGEEEDKDEHEDGPPPKKRRGDGRRQADSGKRGTRARGRGRQPAGEPNVRTRAMAPRVPKNPLLDGAVLARCTGIGPWAFGPDKTTREIAHVARPKTAAI